MRDAQVWGCRDSRERGVCAADPVERGEPRARGSQSELSDAGFPARSSPARGFPARSFRVQASRRVAFRLRLPCVGFRGGDSLVRAFQRGLSGAGFPTQGFQGWGFSTQAPPLHGAELHGAGLHGAGLPETGFTALVPRRSPRFTARGFLPGAGLHSARLHGAGLPETGFTALASGNGLHGAGSPALPPLSSAGFLPGAGVHGAGLPRRSPAPRQTFLPAGAGRWRTVFPRTPRPVRARQNAAAFLDAAARVILWFRLSRRWLRRRAASRRVRWP